MFNRALTVLPQSFRMRGRNGAMTVAQARLRLGVEFGADAEAVGRAFRAAVKSVHPDRPGGDVDELRQVIEAQRVLQSLALARQAFTPAPVPAPPKPEPPRSIRLQIRVCEALFGGERRIDVGGRIVDVSLPAGLRAAEALRLPAAGSDGVDVLLRIGVDAEPGLSVRGHDVWQDVAADQDQLVQGARLEIDTPRGRRAFLAPRAVEGGGLVRLRGEGLPPRGRHPAGDLILRVTAGSADEPIAQRLLRRFAARWAA